MKLTVKAYAKLNLLLDIVGVLPNGYHSLNMIMQSVDLHDTVSVEETDGQGIVITSSDSNVPTDSRNTVWKAVLAFEEYTGKKCTVRINIDKRIPSPAGLAGGSADAAATLYALNIIYNTDLSDSELCRIGSKVGADVPFCIVGGTQLSQNIGDVLSPLPSIGDCHIVIGVPTLPFIQKMRTVALIRAVTKSLIPTLRLFCLMRQTEITIVFTKTPQTFLNRLLMFPTVFRSKPL